MCTRELRQCTPQVESSSRERSRKRQDRKRKDAWPSTAPALLEIAWVLIAAVSDWDWWRLSVSDEARRFL